MKEGNLLMKDKPTDILKLMQGHVFEAIIQEQELPVLQSNYKICNIITVQDGLHVRFINNGGIMPSVGQATEAAPNLEDVYLNYFE